MCLSHILCGWKVVMLWSLFIFSWWVEHHLSKDKRILIIFILVEIVFRKHFQTFNQILCPASNLSWNSIEGMPIIDSYFYWTQESCKISSFCFFYSLINPYHFSTFDDLMEGALHNFKRKLFIALRGIWVKSSGFSLQDKFVLKACLSRCTATRYYIIYLFSNVRSILNDSF